MTRARSGRRALAVACLLALMGSGCTPSDPPAPPPTTTPSPTPTENAQEREERLAYEAAEKSYREARHEFRRLTDAGGALEATMTLKGTAGGPYLGELVRTVRAYKAVGNKTKGTESIGWVRAGGYSPSELVLLVCEDDSQLTALDRKGKVLGRGDVLQLQLKVRLSGGSWRVWDGDGKKVSTCSS